MSKEYLAICLFVIGQFVTAGGLYAAIRADLREAMVTASVAAKRAEDANIRIDRILQK